MSSISLYKTLYILLSRFIFLKHYIGWLFSHWRCLLFVKVEICRPVVRLYSLSLFIVLKNKVQKTLHFLKWRNSLVHSCILMQRLVIFTVFYRLTILIEVKVQKTTTFLLCAIKICTFCLHSCMNLILSFRIRDRIHWVRSTCSNSNCVNWKQCML